MKVSVKLLQGDEHGFEVSPSQSITQLKSQIETKFNISSNLQKLVFKGKTLADDLDLANYDIPDGARIFLFLKKAPASSGSDKAKLSKGPLYDRVEAILLKHVPKESIPAIMDAFEKEIQNMPYKLSLDDIERISETYMDMDDNNASSECS